MSCIPILIKLGVLVGLSLVEPLYHLTHHEIQHQDHEAHEEEYYGLEKRKASIQSIKSVY